MVMKAHTHRRKYKTIPMKIAGMVSTMCHPALISLRLAAVVMRISANACAK